MFLNPVFQKIPGDAISNYKKIPKWIKDQFQISSNQIIKPEDQDYIYRILVQILKYPDKRLAQLHRLANRLGKNDLKSQKLKNNKQKSKEFNQSKQNIFTQDSINDNQPLQGQKQSGQQFCQCCGFIKQKQQITICQSFQQFPTIGLSTFLYFRSIINCSIMLLILFVIYCLWGMFINYYIYIQGQGLTVLTGLQKITSQYVTIFSYKSIQLNYIQHQQKIIIYTRISAILIIIVITIWSFLVYVFKHFQVQYEQMIDDQSITASDFAIVIQHAPIQLFKDTHNIARQFNQYFKSISHIIQKQYFNVYLKNKQNINTQQQFNKLKLTKINIGIPFYLNQNNLQTDQQYKLLQLKLQDHKNKFIEWVIQFFQNKKLTVKQDRRQKRLSQYLQIYSLVQSKKLQFIKSLQSHHKSNNTSDQMTTTVFITFQSSLAAKIIYQLNPHGFLPGLKYYLTCCNNDRLLKIKNSTGKTLNLKISRAPQPQDIIWQNIGFSFGKILSRRLLTYIITIAILTGSYFLITFLSKIQLSSDNFFVGIAISLSLTILNIAIGIVIYTLTVFQKDFTHTNYQASLSLKSVFASLINSIMIPVMIKQNNIYGKAGLVQDVFWLAITTAFIDPFLNLFDVYYLYTRIRYWLKSKSYSRIGLEQQALNDYAQKMEFQAGFEYIYVTNSFLISCFFTPIQPIIPLVSAAGLFFMYWTQKYSLLNRKKRPIPGSDMINVAMGSVITLGPIMLGVGAMVFSDFLSAHGQGNLKFLLHLIAIGIGVFFYVLPFKLIYRCIFSEDEVFLNLSYFQNRILLPSQYDRINPATAQQGMKDFMNYLKQVNDMFNNNQNQTSTNNQLANNLAKFVEKSQQNPHSKQVSNLKNIADNMNQYSVLDSLLGPKNLKNAIHGMNQQKKSNNLPIQYQQKSNKVPPKQSNPQPTNHKQNKQKQINNQKLKSKQNNSNQFLRQRNKKIQSSNNNKSSSQNNGPFVKQTDQNEQKVFDKQPPKIKNTFEFNNVKSQQKNEGLLGMEIKPYKSSISTFNENLPTNNYKKIQRNLKTQPYQKLQQQSPVKQNSQIPKKIQKVNFLKINNNKNPKIKSSENRIMLNNEILNSAYRQKRSLDQSQPYNKINKDNILQGYRNNKFPNKQYQGSQKHQQNVYQQKRNSVQHPIHMNEQEGRIRNDLNNRRKSMPYNNQGRKYASNRIINGYEHEEYQDRRIKQEQMQFNGYKINSNSSNNKVTKERQRRKKSRNNILNTYQQNKISKQRSFNNISQQDQQEDQY